MQRIGKLLLVLLSLALITTALALTIVATDAQASETIIVGQTQKPDSEEAYTLEEAWAYAEGSQADVEVIVNANADTYTENLSAINKANKKTTLQLYGDIATTKAISIAKGADITIDVSGASLTVSHQMSIETTAKVTFRTTSAAGTILGGKNGIVYIVASESANPEVAFVSSTTEENLLSVNAKTPIVMFGNQSTVGTIKISFNNGSYTSVNEIIRLNTNPQKKPCALALSGENATFKLTEMGMLRLNLPDTFTANGGAIALGSYASFKDCAFETTDTSKNVRNFFRSTSDSDFNGRFFGKLTFDSCSFLEVVVNGDEIISYAKQTGEDADGNPIYDSNYPYLPSGGTASKTSNCLYDYRPDIVAAGWTTDGQITFRGKCTFDSSMGNFNSTKDGFAYENVVGESICYNVFCTSVSNQTVYTESAYVETLDDFNAYLQLSKDLARYTIIQLKADITLDQGLTINKSQNFAIDLNGHTLTLVSTTARNTINGNLHIFSSAAGGVLTSASNNGLFFVNSDAGTPTVVFGREEDALENLSVSSTANVGSAGIFIFSNSYVSESMAIRFYNTQLSTKHYLIKLNSSASKEVAPTVQITMKGCSVALTGQGLLTYNDNQTLDTDTTPNNGRFAVGTSLTVEDSSIVGTGGYLFNTKFCAQTADGAAVSNFKGRFYGTVTFKNTSFEKVTMNCTDLYSSKDNLAQNGANKNYVVPDDWDPSKQVTFDEGCTFKNTSNLLNENATGLVATLNNTVLAENTVIAYTESIGKYAVLAKDNTVEITWALPDTQPYTLFYKKGVSLQIPLADVTVNGNTYTRSWDNTPELAIEDMTYTVTGWTGGAQLSANYSLNAAIDFNAYVPVSREITHINGKPVAEIPVRALSAKQFWMVTFEDLAPKDAYKSKHIALTVNLDDKTTVTVDRYISLIGYARSALKSNADDSLKHLVLCTLDYINKANLYFNEDAESVEQIDELLTTYEFTPYEWTESNVKDISGTYENALGVGLDLSRAPGFVIYIKPDYTGTVTVNGKEYTEDDFVLVGESCKYVIVEMKAYNMRGDLSITVGADQFEYNLDTFIKTNPSSAAYSHALYGYTVAAEEYLKTQE